MKILISLALLFSFAFSTVHEYVFTFYDTESCDITEYVNELNAPSNHGDICDIHFMYHQVFILTSYIPLPQNLSIDSKREHINESYTFKTTLKFTKPPIA